MKKLVLSAFAFAALAAQAADLSVEVSVPPQKQGAVLAAVFDKAEGFPRGKPLQTTMGQAANGKAVVQFANLPAGEYAVTAFLDENGNTQLDSNVFGVPTELYGFSRDARNLVGPPPFADAVIRVDGAANNHSFELK